MNTLTKSIMNYYGGKMAKKKEEVVESKSKGGVWASTSSTLLDIVAGGGTGKGLEFGQVVNLVAESGQGKTAVINEIIANAYHTYKDKLSWVYDSTKEGGNSFNTKKLYGVQIVPEDPEEQVRSQTAEEAYGSIATFCKSIKPGHYGIYALDSLDAVASKEIEEAADGHEEAFKKDKEYTKGSYGGQKPKFLSQIFLPNISAMAEEHNCLILIVSQLRDNVNGGLYASKDKISNGRALIFYLDTRLWFKVAEKIEKNGRQIGATIQAWSTKTRGELPYRDCLFTFYYTYGIDNIISNIDFLYDLRTPEQGKLRASKRDGLVWDGTEFSRNELVAHIEDNKLENELSNRVIALWNQKEEEATAMIRGRKKRYGGE